jgi:pyruvate-formate lyase-activating enzyme
VRARLLFADERGRVYDHPELLAAARSGDEVVRPAGKPVPLPPGSGLCVLPGRRPVGIDPASGALTVLHEVKLGRRRIVPVAVGATLPPGYTRTLLPAAARPPLATVDAAPVLPQWAYTAAGWAQDGSVAGSVAGPVVYALRTDRRAHWDPRAHSTPDLPARVDALVATGNPIYRQLARCALEWRCFTAQNTFYGRDEGAIPSSSSCNAACIGCLSEADPGLPPSSHERIARAPTAEEMADLAVRHLEGATGRVMVSFGQGCEGEPLTRWKEIAKAIRLIRARTRRGSIHANTNGSLPEALGALIDAGLDSIRVSLNSASPELYEAYYRPTGYGLADVIRSVRLARRRGVYVALNLLTFPGVTDREGEARRLCALVAATGVEQVQTRPLAIDPDLYMSLARDRGGRGPAMGIPALVRALKRARPGLAVGNFSRARSERKMRAAPRPKQRPGARRAGTR